MTETERLYYQDSYLRDFAARVTARRAAADGRVEVALDRTAFYPTGGGQPNDTGRLGDRAVLDVMATDGLVWHTVDGDVPDTRFCESSALSCGPVSCQIDWARRFEHMQQHTGQHILSQAAALVGHAETVGFHLGAAVSTIDLDRADLAREDLEAVEAEANRAVDADLPVTVAWVDEIEIAHVPLRRPPKVSGAIRVVQVAGYDWSACGGTHVSSSAQVGLVKITATERRGAETRVSFVCGGRARADYGRLQSLAESLSARFTVGQDELPAAADRLIAELRSSRRDLADLEKAWAESKAEALWSTAATQGRWRVVVAALDGPVDRVKLVAQALRVRGQAAILLGIRGERPQLICTRSDGVSIDAGSVLRSAAAAAGGRGGGRPDWAQGGVPTEDALQAALKQGGALLLP